MSDEKEYGLWIWYRVDIGGNFEDDPWFKDGPFADDESAETHAHIIAQNKKRYGISIVRGYDDSERTLSRSSTEGK